MFAIDVPVTRTPEVSVGIPAISAAQRITWRSTSIGAWSRPPRLAFRPPAINSASMPTAFPPPWTQPMKRGCTLPVTNGTMRRCTASYASVALPGSLGSGDCSSCSTPSGVLCQTGRPRTSARLSNMSSTTRCPRARSSLHSSGSKPATISACLLGCRPLVDQRLPWSITGAAAGIANAAVARRSKSRQSCCSLPRPLTPTHRARYSGL